jgi:hypothetical protein
LTYPPGENTAILCSTSIQAANRAVAATAPLEGAKKVRNQEGGAQTPLDSYSIFLTWVCPICFITAGPFYFDIVIPAHTAACVMYSINHPQC